MTERAEVEALLAEVHAYTGRKSGLIAELCRTWLAVQEAPVATVQVNRGYMKNCNHYAPAPEAMNGQRVRLVRDGGES